jgi:hypothetical protein
VAVQLDLRLSGPVAKRGLRIRTPAADRILTDAETWLRTEYPEQVRWIRPLAAATEAAAGRSIGLHPAAPDLRLDMDEDGLMTAAATTIPTGPGYHTFVARLLERLGEELGVDWHPVDSTNEPAPEQAAFAAGDRATAERVHLAWLQATLLRARDARRLGARGIHVGTPAGVVFSVDEALATAIGPRDDDWLERASGDASVAVDITPWWADAMNGKYLLDRAMCLLWTEVRWRKPVDDDERAIDDEALRLLRRAYPLDPSLPFPWSNWLELVELRGGDEPMIHQIRERAKQVRSDGQVVGYRREPVTVLHEGWALEVPGSFAERRTDEEWWGGEGGRSIRLAATETALDGQPMGARTFLDQVAGDLGGEVLNHADGPVLGRAKLGMDGSTGVGQGVLDGFSAVTGRGAAIRIEFDEPGDWQWAIDMWRALHPAPAT